jgi:16S rRNA (guanine527-N7)-methyltransferase
MPAADPAVPEAVLGILEEAQGQGVIGKGPLQPHVVHSLGFAAAVAGVRGTPLTAADRVADLGTGAGLPGLVLAAAFPEVSFTLIEGSTRRAVLLQRSVQRYRWESRVDIEAARAEVVGRMPEQRGAYTVVVARLFGTPAATAECAAPLLQEGGLLVVSEPPAEGEDRWPESGLAEFGLRWVRVVGGDAGRFAVLRQVERCPDRFPRRTGVPARRPLF